MSKTVANRCSLLVVLCASIAAFAAHAQAPRAPSSIQDASLRLDWVPTWYQTPFYLALDRGYYKAAGLNLTIGQGKGSTTTAQVVGAGSDTFGLMDASIMMLAASSGAPLKAIGGYIQRSPDAAIFLSTSNIKAPKDLEGKRWGYAPGSSSESLFPLFAKKTGIDESKITKITMDPSEKLSFLLTGRVDIIADWAVTVDPLVVAQGKTPGDFVYANYGVFFIARVLATSTKTIATRPDVVKAFVSGTARGIDEAVKNPTAAVDALLAHQPEVTRNRELMVSQVKNLADFLHSRATVGKPPLWMARNDIAATLDVAKQLRPMPTTTTADNLFTNEFIIPKQ